MEWFVRTKYNDCNEHIGCVQNLSDGRDRPRRGAHCLA